MSEIIAAITVLALLMSSAMARRPETGKLNSLGHGQANIAIIRSAQADEASYQRTPDDRRREEEVMDEGVLIRLRVIDHE